MKWLLLLSFVSCSSLKYGLGAFGEIQEYEAKLVNQDLSGRLVETEKYIPYVVGGQGCFDKGVMNKGDVITTRYEDHEVLLHEMNKIDEVWTFSDADQRGKVYASPVISHNVASAKCNITYFYNIIFAFDGMYVSFVRTKK